MNHFKGKQFQKDVIIVAVGYYLRYNLSGSVAKLNLVQILWLVFQMVLIRSLLGMQPGMFPFI